jgi:hypothetical protein
MNHLLVKPHGRTGLVGRSVLPRLLVAILLACLCLPLRAQTDTPDAGAPQSLPKVTLHVGKVALETEIASTPAEEARGLMFRAHLPDNSGMIFFLHPGHATFWMKNTHIPLSVAFLDKNGLILEIHDMKPLDETITRSDSDQVAFALETNLHWFALNGIKPGEKVDPPPATLMKTASP